MTFLGRQRAQYSIFILQLIIAEDYRGVFARLQIFLPICLLDNGSASSWRRCHSRHAERIHLTIVGDSSKAGGLPERIIILGIKSLDYKVCVPQYIDTKHSRKSELLVSMQLCLWGAYWYCMLFLGEVRAVNGHVSRGHYCSARQAALDHTVSCA